MIRINTHQDRGLHSKHLDLEGIKLYLLLEPAKQQSHNQDQEQEANQSRSPVAPTAAVWPDRQASYQKEN